MGRWLAGFCDPGLHPFRRSAVSVVAAGAGVPEEREYRAIGVKGNNEFGLPSEIVSAVWHK